MNFVAAQVLLANKLKMEKIRKMAKATEESITVKNSPLQGIVGIGEKTVERLIQAGITNTDDLRATPTDKLERIITNPISRQQLFTFLKYQDYAKSNGGRTQEGGEEEGA